MKKIVIFSGAGVSRESGILTFRDSKDGLWNNYNVDEVATPQGWKANRELVLNFYNERRRQLPEVFPNEAHKDIAKLEEHYDVTVVTQNIDDLHERGGSTNIIHLHGEITKARGSMYQNKQSIGDNVIDIGYEDIKLGDKCPVTDSQLRPHICWFSEQPFNVTEAYVAISEADILIIIGTSLEITYTIDMLASFGVEKNVYYIDPNPSNYLDNLGMKIKYIKQSATEGIKELISELNSQ